MWYSPQLGSASQLSQIIKSLSSLAPKLTTPSNDQTALPAQTPAGPPPAAHAQIIAFFRAH